jgi:hypothetical protein
LFAKGARLISGIPSICIIGISIIGGIGKGSPNPLIRTVFAEFLMAMRTFDKQVLCISAENTVFGCWLFHAHGRTHCNKNQEKEGNESVYSKYFHLNIYPLKIMQ